MRVLRELKADTEAILKDLPQMDGPVNWADLHCVQAEYVMSDNGSAYFRVVLSEAAPDAEELQEKVREALRSGWGLVEVVTEW